MLQWILGRFDISQNKLEMSRKNLIEEAPLSIVTVYDFVTFCNICYGEVKPGLPGSTVLLCLPHLFIIQLTRLLNVCLIN